MENSPHKNPSPKLFWHPAYSWQKYTLKKNKGLQTEPDFLLTDGGAKKKEISAKECLC